MNTITDSDSFALNLDTLKQLLDNAGVAIACYDLDGRLLYHNRKSAQLMGGTPADFTGKMAAELFDSDFSKLMLERIQQVSKSRQAVRYDDTRVVLATGEVWFSSMYSAIEKTGEVIAIQIAAQDITERKQAEEKLRESEGKWRDLFEILPVGVSLIDSQNNVVELNTQLARILNISREGLIRGDYRSREYLRHDSTLMSREEFPSVRAVAEHRPVMNVEIGVKMENDSLIWTSVSSAPLSSETGSVTVTADITEQKLTENALRDTSRLLQASIESPAGIVIMAIDKNYRYLCFNTAHRESMKYAYNKDVGTGMNILECITSDEDRKKARENYDRAMTGESHSTIEVYGDVNKSYYESFYNPIYNEQNQIIGITAYAMNITERKLAEEQTQKLNARLVEAQAVTKVGSWETDLSNWNVVWSEETYRIFGLDSSSFKASHPAFMEFVHPEDRAKVDAVFEESFGKDAYNMVEHRIITSSRKVKFVEERWKIFRDAEGQPVRAVGTCQDITERKLAEEALRESEERLRLSLKAANQGLYDLNVQTGVTSINQEYAQMLGYDPETFIETNAAWIERLHPDDNDITTKAYSDYVNGLTNEYRVEFRQKTKDGHWKWILSIGKILEYDAAGKPLRMLGTHTDITQLKNLEEERRKLSELLQESQKLEAVGTLAGGIAHDFNNILTGILGHASLLKIRTKDNPENYRSALTIEGAAERAAELTGQLLGFARKGKHRIQPVDINKTIADVVRLLERTIDKGISIQQIFASGEPIVKGDPGQMQQVLMNLALNACDAMPESGKLTFQTEIVPADEKFDLKNSKVSGRYLKISVSDTGQGIQSDHLNHIFEPFFTTKEQGKGTGMGLAMVYGIVQNHGGHIDVSSEVGVGTTFRIYLPLEEGLKVEKLVLPADTNQTGSGRILLIDDESLIRDIASEILRSLGYQVSTAVDGEDAVRMYREDSQKFDLVIIDMMMPNLNGRDCFRELKKIKPQIKAILSSGYSLEGRAQEILDEGVIGFIQKPYTVDRLGKAVAEAMA